MSDKPQTTRTQVRGVLNRPDGAGRVRRHAGHPQAAHAARRAPQRRPPRRRSAGSTSCAWWSTPPRRSAPAIASSRRGSLPTGWWWSTRSTPRRPTRCWRSWPRRPTSSPSTTTSRCRRCTGEGVDELVAHLIDRLPEGPQLYPDDMVTDVPEAFWVAELVREQLLAITHDELPALDRHPRHRVGVAADPRRDPGRARLAEGHRDRPQGVGPQGRGHRGARAAGARARSSSCSSRSTRTGSAAPRPSSASATDASARLRS